MSSQVKTYLDFIHKSFVIATIDKDTNNYALIYKIFYLNLLLKEVRIIGSWNSKTYSKVAISKDDIANAKRQTKRG